jgi:peptidylprolyl isomerase
MRTPRLAALATLPFLALAACSSSSSSSSITSPSVTTFTTLTTLATPTTAASASPTTTNPPGKFGTKPTVVVPSGPPPTSLVSEDLITGSGAAAKAGDSVSVQYVGVSYTTKQQFDASWDRGQAFSFTLGAQMVIPGWDQGVVGMQVGGRRLLIIPPNLAYGASPPAGSNIPPNDTLIFIVDLVTIG